MRAVLPIGYCAGSTFALHPGKAEERQGQHQGNEAMLNMHVCRALDESGHECRKRACWDEPINASEQKKDYPENCGY
jgi:hypothetical protein